MKQHSFIRKAICATTALLIILTAFTTVRMESQARALARTHQATAQDILDELNDIREDYGCADLAMSDELTRCAAIRSSEISTYFSHTRPDGSQWYTINASLQYGENLLKTQINHEADDIVQMWMDSPSHKDLIVDGYYRTVGIARYHYGDTDYWVLEFGYR